MKAKIFILILTILPGFYTVFGQGMIIGPNASVTVAGGGKLIITDAVKGMLTIKSTSAGTGSLVVDANAASSVSVAAHSNVERYLTLGTWHYISSPITNGLSGIFFGDYLMTSDQTTTTGWAPYIVSTTTPLDVMRGYAVWKPASNSAWQEVFAGNLNNGNLTIDVSRVTGTWAGWTLVGNPYPCAIDLTSGGVTWTNVEPTAWFWNEAAGNYQAHGTITDPSPPWNGGSHSQFVPAMQGFYVHATTSPASLSFTNAVRVNNTESFLKSTPYPFLMIKAQGYTNTYFDMISVQFDPDATSCYDPGYDAYKLWGLNEAPQLYTLINDTNVTCNSLPFSKANMVVPMGFKCGSSGNYTLIADNLGSFDQGISISLEDIKLNIIQDLRSNPGYNFSYNTTDNSNRFLLLFNNPTFGTNDNSAPENIQIYSFGDAVFIKTNSKETANGQVFIYDPIGKDLFHANLSGDELTKISPDLNTGYYVVKVVTGKSVSSKKVFISR
jgi:hypothetical protein